MTLEHFLSLIFGDIIAYANRILDWIEKNIINKA